MSTRTVLAFGDLLEGIICDNKWFSKQMKSLIFGLFPGACVQTGLSNNALENH